MKRYSMYLALFLLGAAFFTAKSESLDWPQWQGPDRNAISKETGLLKEWPEGSPPLAWNITGIGGGYGGLSIAEGKIYGISNRGDKQVVWALSEKDGKELWATPIGPTQTAGMPQGIEGGGCTPTVDGDRLYVIGYGGELACLQVKDGKIVWQLNMVTDLGGALPTWRYNESPLIDGEKLICTPGGNDATIAALNKMSGETIWKCLVPGHSSGESGGGRRGFRQSGASYASAIAIDFGGVHQYVQFTSKAVVGVSADGKFLWRYDRPANKSGINCSSPIYHDGYVFAASAYGAGGGLAKLSKEADGGIKAEEVYHTRYMENHHGGMILYDGALYGANGGNGGGFLVCLDFITGDVLWNERSNRGLKKGSITMADSLLYYRTEEGTVVLIEPNKEKMVEHGRFEQPGRTHQPAWTHPVFANGKLYIRDQDALFCYDVKAK